MKRSALISVSLGFLIALAGAIQLALAIYLSPDDNPNLVGNGMIWTICLAAGATVASIGLIWAGYDRWPPFFHAKPSASDRAV